MNEDITIHDAYMRREEHKQAGKFLYVETQPGKHELLQFSSRDPLPEDQLGDTYYFCLLDGNSQPVKLLGDTIVVLTSPADFQHYMTRKVITLGKAHDQSEQNLGLRIFTGPSNSSETKQIQFHKDRLPIQRDGEILYKVRLVTAQNEVSDVEMPSATEVFVE